MARDWSTPVPGLHFLQQISWLGVVWAGLLRGGEGSVLGEEAAAYLHDALRDAPPLVAVWSDARRERFSVGSLHVVYRRGTRQGFGSPMKTSVEDSLLDLARVTSEDATVAAVARALAQRRTTPQRILAALGQRRATRHSAVIRGLCDHGAVGIESALEWRFHQQVVLPHRLPQPERQVRAPMGRADGLYREACLVVELDGMRDHVDWSKDMARDNARLVIDGVATLRYGWIAVTQDPCRVASQLADALNARGWGGKAKRCRRCPEGRRTADLVA